MIQESQRVSLAPSIQHPTYHFLPPTRPLFYFFTSIEMNEDEDIHSAEKEGEGREMKRDQGFWLQHRCILLLGQGESSVEDVWFRSS